MSEQQTSEAPAAVTPAPAPPTFKVFAGNLAFATTDDSLKQFFAQTGEVVDAHVVTRGNRSVGYGFVDYPSQELADKAVSELDKQALDGRTINVELARAREEGAAEGEGARQRNRRGRGRGRGGRGGFRGPPGGIPPPGVPGGPYAYPPRGYRPNYYANYYEGYYDPNFYGGFYQGPSRGAARAPRPTGRRARQREEEGEGAENKEDAPAHEGGEEQQGEEGGRGRRRTRGGFRRGRGGREPRAPREQQEGEEYQGPPPGAPPRGRGGRRGRGGPRRAPRKPRDENQEPSQTTLFIANLPYELNEEGLLEVFKDYQPKQARIARARGRSKGFGFVQLETNELQQKAAAEIDNTEVQGRVLNVKPAVVDLSIQPEPEAEPEAAAEAPQVEASA